MGDDCCRSKSGRISADIAVVGAGSAGFAAAIRAAELGAQVALVGHGAIGGTCVNVGCVPSKTLIRAAETLHGARSASRFRGVVAQARVEDWAAVVGQKDELVASLRQAKYSDLLPSYNNIAYLEGRARLVPHGVALNGTEIAAGRTIITTGARPSVPPIPGLSSVPYLTSTTAMELENLPATLAIIGGGVIACELGQLFARTGVSVTILCRSKLLPGTEPEVSEALSRYLADEGVAVKCGISYRSIRKDAEGISIELAETEGEVSIMRAEALLVAAGRTPNIEGLGLDELGIEYTSHTGIRVDDHLRTTRPGIYAAGDVTGEDMFVYMAAYGARIAAENALNGDGRRYDSTVMPEVVFTDPQVAKVGVTEAEARRRLEVKAVVLPLDQVPRAIAARDTRGLIKLVAERQSGRLIGAHIVAPEAGDSIQTAALAIQQGLNVSALADMIFPYLTTVEGLKLAALAFTKDVHKLSCCAG